VEINTMIARHGGTCAFGDTPTIADCHIVPQVYSAERCNVPLNAWPALMRAVANCRAIPAVAKASPDRQADRPV